MNTSYKNMLRDRCPAVIDLALRWCKAKTKWLDHVYQHFINIYVLKEERYEATRIILGISGKYRNFNFEKTIDWDNIDSEEEEYWKTILGWVNWFRNRHAAIEQDIRDQLTNSEIIAKYKELNATSTNILEYIRANL